MKPVKTVHVLQIVLLLAALPLTSVHAADSVYSWWIGLPAPAASPATFDTINVIQWKVADGGNDHWYAVANECTYWVEAYNMAPTFIIDGKPGYLATITSPEENAFIFDSVIAGTNTPCILDQFSLGGIELGGTWTWITGEPFTMFNWAPGEPNNIGIETALGMWGPTTTHPLRVPSKWNNALTNRCVNPHSRFWSVIEWGDPQPTSQVVVCGNGITDAGEDCDDGNVYGGDGCSECCTGAGSPCGANLLGDVDCDGVIDLRDLVHLGNILDGFDLADACSSCTGDVNDDSAIDELDYMLLYDSVADLL